MKKMLQHQRSDLLRYSLSYTKHILIVMAILCGTFINGFAQIDRSKILEKTKTTELQNLAAAWTADFTTKKEQARQIALARGIPLTIESRTSFAELMDFDKDGIPLYYETNNVEAAISIRTNHLHTGGSTGFNLDGNGMTIGEWDAAGFLLSHEQFGGRVNQVDGAANLNSRGSNHAIHVGGTLIGDGIGVGPNAASAKGMAPQANLSAHDWTNDNAEMATFAAGGGLVSNHSYGWSAGWRPDSGGGFTWLGGSNNVEDPNFGKYTFRARDWDVIANNAPHYLICKAAGNDNGDGASLSNGDQFYDAQSQSYVAYNSAIHAGPDGPFDCISQIGNAKNILTVGATEDVPNYNTALDVVIASFSSAGGTDDGRIKPDITGNGVNLYSAEQTSNTSYRSISGTSMATPSVAGSLILLQEHYENLNGAGNFMLASTLKALAIHTAKEAGQTPGPDYTFGWGLMDSEAAAQQITSNVAQPNSIIEATLNDGDTYTVTVPIDPNQPFIATLVWNDPAAAAAPAGIDDPTPALVNDLDMRGSENGITYFPWVLDPANPTAAATGDDNFRDNVEKIYIIDGPAGADVTITISHKGNLMGGSQDFSLIISDIVEGTCEITNITTAPGTINCPGSTFDKEITVSYIDPPSGSSLVVNGQTFPVTASPQTVVLTGLPLLGGDIDVNASFSTNANCSYVATELIIPPSSCFPPANDTCANPTQLLLNSCGTTYSTGSPTNSGFTPDFSCGFTGPGFDVWYYIVVPPSGNLSIETTQIVNPDGLTDLVMQTYLGSAASCASLTPLQCDDDSGEERHARVRLIGLTPGDIVMIRIIEYGSNQEGFFGLCALELPSQENDECIDATLLSVDLDCSMTTYSIVTPTVSSTMPGFSCYNAQNMEDVWFSVVVPGSGTLNIETEQVAGSNISDMVMQVYDGTCGNLNQVDCGDFIVEENLTIYFPALELTGLTPGSTLYIRLLHYSSAAYGDFNICAYNPSPNFTCDSPFQITTCGTYESYAINQGASASQGSVDNFANPLHATWFEYIPTFTGTIDVFSCDGGTDTRLWIHDGSCSALNLIGQADDECQMTFGSPSYASQELNIPVTQGVPIFIEWDSYWSQSGFEFTIDGCPNNYTCVSATELTSCGTYTATAPNQGASPSQSDASNSSWYKFTSPVTGIVDIYSCNGGENTRLWVHGGTCTALTLLASADDNCQMSSGSMPYASEVTGLAVTAGVPIYIEWDDKWSSQGFNFTIDCLGCEDASDPDMDGIASCIDQCPNDPDVAMDFTGGNDDPNGDYIEVPHHPDLNIVDGDFSIEAWIYSTGTGHRTIVSKGNGFGTTITPYVFGIWDEAVGPGSGRLGLYLSGDWQWGNPVIPQNQWIHIAVSFDYNTKTASFYYNGVLDGQPSYNSANTVFSNNDTNPMFISRQGFAFDKHNFTGKMDDISIWNKALSQAEIQSNMTGSLAGTETDLIAHFNFNENDACQNNTANPVVTDIGPNGHQGTLKNFFLGEGCHSNWVSGKNIEFGGADMDGLGDCFDLCPNDQDMSLNFENRGEGVGNTSDYVEVPHDPAFNLVDGDFAFEAWVNPTSAADTRSIVTKGTGNGGSSNYMFDIIRNDDTFWGQPGRLGLFLFAGGAVEGQFSNSIIALNKWTHVAVSVDNSGSNPVATFYVNGVADGGGTYAFTTLNNANTLPLLIGRQGSNTQTNQFEGRMDEVAVWDKILLAADIAVSMSAPYAGTEANLVAYYDFNDANACIENGGNTTLIDKANSHDGTLMNFDLSSGCSSNWAAGHNQGACEAICLPDMELTSAQTQTADYISGGYISSDQTIVSPAQVDYDATTEISLLENFEVKPGAVFHAFINGCTAATLQDMLDAGFNIPYLLSAGYTAQDLIGLNHDGGIIFYIDASNGTGLIAAPIDQSNAEWGCLGTNVPGGNGTAIGTGHQNTIDIIGAGCSSAANAVNLCADLSLNGYNDWFLPSINELYALYQNRGAVGGFSTGLYWSSTEDDIQNEDEKAFVISFGNGASSSRRKIVTLPVRAIRAF